MPELPEVEIVKQSLEKRVLLQKINKVIVRNGNLRFKIEKNFKNILKNRKILNISRISKYLIIHFDNEKYCILHLGMSGTLHLVKKNLKNKFTNLSFYKSKILPIKHNHVEIIFSKFKIVYNDPRRFGFFKIINSKKELNFFFKPFKPEALDGCFNIKYLKKKIINKKKNIKNLLLDQNFVSGIGNIYASEILYYSKINPERIGNKIQEEEMKKIIKFTKFVLEKAIKKGGSSINNFRNIEGETGKFQKEFKVYDREHKKCSRNNCEGIIKKKIISNRSTFFCNYCQKY